MEMINLTHVQLTAPQADIRVTSYKELSTSRGVAFTANIRRGKTLLGYAENKGCGDATTFIPVNREASVEFAAFVKKCRRTGRADEELYEEYVLDELVEEYTIGLEIQRYARRGKTMVRSWTSIVEDVCAAEIYGFAKASDPAETVARAEKALARMACEPGTRWEIWDWADACWRGISSTPASDR